MIHPSTPSMLPVLLVATTLLSAGINGHKLSILVVSPSTKMTTTHFEWHKQFATRLANDERVDKVLLLGLTESLDEELTEGAEKTGVNKLTIWKRNRWGKKANQFFSTKPIKSEWRRREVERIGDAPKTYYLDLVLHNPELMAALRGWQFNLGCIETVGLDGLQLGILHVLGIKNTCATSSVMPSIQHWHFLMGERTGAERELIRSVPGLNLAQIGDHLRVLNGEKVFEAKNRAVIEKKAIVGEKTHALWKRELRKIGKKLGRIGKNLPTMAQLFKSAHFFFVNSQLTLDYKLVEKEVQKVGDRENLPKLRFIGGIGMEEEKHSKKENNKEGTQERLDKMTRAIFEKEKPVVLVSFGSVVDVGMYTEEDEKRVKAELEEMLTNRKEKAEDEETKAKINRLKEELLLISECLAKEAVLVDVFEQFHAQNAEHLEFIWKYGKKQEGEEVEYKKLGKQGNVHGKGWLMQKEILAQGTSKVRAFISHCGQNSAMEAVKSGIPLICLPFFGDQLNISEALASRGVAISIDIETYDKEEVKEGEGKTIENQRKEADQKFRTALFNALQTMIGNDGEKYGKNMKKLQEKFNAANPVGIIGGELKLLMEEEEKAGRA